MNRSRTTVSTAAFLVVASALGALTAACSRPRDVANDAPDVAAPAASNKSYGDKTALVFDLTAGAPEASDAGGLFGLPASRTYVGLLSALKDAGQHKDVGAVFVSLGERDVDWARAEELGRLFGELRSSGKPVVCHAHGLGNSTSLFVARACDRIWISPAGGVETVGLAGQVIFLKGVLDKLGVQADFLHMGKYKSFAEQFTREDPSPEARESLLVVLRSIRTTWIASVKQYRPGAESALEDGPWGPEQAKAHKLADDIGYESDAVKDAQERGKADKVKIVFGPHASGAGGGDSLAALIRSISGANRSSGGDRIAVIPAVGGISMTSGGFGGGISASSLTKTLRRVAKDDGIKAVVLRIDSPGGSALASDLLWHELMEVRAKKPLIASVGSMAASGGYYMACAASEIFAEQSSIVGSIGVVGGKFTFNQALAGQGINAVTIAARQDDPGAKARAAFMSPLEPWDDATRERMRQLMSGTYDLFVKRVADGRGLKVSDVEPNAQGRIWSGTQGKDKRLVDQLGGLRDAIERARQLAKLEPDAAVSVEGGTDGLLDMLGGGDDASAEQLTRVAERLIRERESWLLQVAEPLLPHAQAFAPVLTGEHTLAVLPYALVLH